MRLGALWVRWQRDVHGEERGLERELMGNAAAAHTGGAVRQQWPDTAEGLRGVPGLLEQDKGLFGEGTLSLVQRATAQAWHQLKGKIGRRSSSTLNKNNKLPSPPKDWEWAGSISGEILSIYSPQRCLCGGSL